ncbi:hypothetical protein RZS08_67375, partial [Arthrospira platensis SPKY1]|nr:hypothetical protein [Arthrospira platensis SPKY1]
MNVSGWRDMLIQLPQGAEQSILRVVSQGGPQYLVNDTAANGSNSGVWKTAAQLGVTVSYQNVDGIIRSSFTQGVDYSNADIRWVDYNLTPPDPDASWESLSQAQ